MDYAEIIKKLKTSANPDNVKGMARFGINSKNTLGIPIPTLRILAKTIGKNHELALKLWKSGIHEARMLAGFIDDPVLVTNKQMEDWAGDFDSWDVCDQVCSNLFDKTRFAYQKAIAWSKRKEEFTKRAGFAMMACLSVHDKQAGDKRFSDFFPLIKQGASDERNFVKKAVNWALRQIGKRNLNLRKEALKTAREIQKLDSRHARWIVSDAIKELTSAKIERKKQ